MDPELLKTCTLREFKKGDTVLHQDEEGDGMYIIKEGKVDVFRDDEHLATLEEGDFFGEIGLLLHERRSATVRAASDKLVAYFCSKEQFEEVRDKMEDEVLDKALERYGETYRKYI